MMNIINTTDFEERFFLPDKAAWGLVASTVVCSAGNHARVKNDRHDLNRWFDVYDIYRLRYLSSPESERTSMKNGKLTYDEILHQKKRLEAKVEWLERAMKESERYTVGYRVDRWVSLPLPQVQKDAVLPILRAACVGKPGTERGSGHRESVIHVDDLGHRPLAEYVAYLVRYRVDDQDGIVDMEIWALVPV